MSKRVFFLVHDVARRNAYQAVQDAPEGYCVEVKERTRTLEQNAKLWAMLGDVARQIEWHGQKLTAENWKDMFSASLKRQAAVPGIDGGFVVLGTRTSRMTKSEMAELIELMYAFGAERGVQWSDPVEYTQ
jgi:hypothetical protein